MKVAVICTVPAEQQWVSRIDKALKAVVARGEIEYVFSGNVASADQERVTRQDVEAGYTQIVGERFAVEAAARKVAKDDPKVAFLMGGSGKLHAPNFSVFDSDIHEPRLPDGLDRRRHEQERQDRHGRRLPHPRGQPADERLYGRRARDEPRGGLMVTFISSRFDLPKAKEAAFAMIDKGAHVAYAERLGVSDAAKERKVLSIGSIIETQAQDLDTMVASALWHMESTVDVALVGGKAGQFKAEDYGRGSMRKPGGSTLSPLRTVEAQMPQAVKDKVAARQKEVLAGSFTVRIDDNPPKAK